MPGTEAIFDDAKARFPSILLTSVTTFPGVVPLVEEGPRVGPAKGALRRA